MILNKPISTLFIFSTFIGFQLSDHSMASQADGYDLPQGVFGYQETVGDKVVPFNWEASEDDNNIVIKVVEKQKTFYNICDADGATLKWKIKNGDKHDIDAERIGNTLKIQGIRFGNRYDETVRIDERPWYQPLSFSLGSFLNSSQDKTSFWVIRADNIEVTALTAEKIGEETIDLDGTAVETQKVEIRAEGFKSKFWHGTYWYRKKDNLFVRYQSVHGLPGTDETIVELVNSPSGQLDS